MPALAMAAAAWSWVEKMLQLDHVTSAPSSLRVSMRTAVWMVMWRQPAMRAPFKIFMGPYFFLMAIRPGISYSDNSISRRPHSANLKSKVCKNALLSTFYACIAKANLVFAQLLDFYLEHNFWLSWLKIFAATEISLVECRLIERERKFSKKKNLIEINILNILIKFSKIFICSITNKPTDFKLRNKS
ncbi:hypothetical protein BpHYR1_037041 [Brachionus plicatilis]|uniref:Uncharacterized protein n=1 Tax=Brachionus plicatilis TaxID=10195 RepID=A0A3M7SM71_BRAPC|nr:hypothetical protein BpHYR1_037041 [Brachionus plicatilis]